MATIRLPERPLPRYGLAALAGAAGVLCFAPFGLFWLAPLVWGCLFALLLHARSPRGGLLTGLAFGLGFFLCGVSWVYVSLSVFGNMPAWLAAPAAALFCAVMALFPMAAGWSFKRLQPGAIWRQALLFAALFATLDWLRGWILTGFPWLAAGYSQTPPSPLAGYAPLLGVHGLSFLAILCGALLLCRRAGIVAAALVVLAGAGLRGVEWTAPEGPSIDVALIQGNIPQEMKFRPDSFARTLMLYRDLIAEHPAQLTLLPETALPAFIDQLPAAYVEELRTLAARRGGDLILGTVTRDGERYFNSAASLGSAPAQTYSKSHLVPFGEFIPPGFAWFMAYANIPMSSFSRGADEQPPLAVAGTKVAVNICYEDAFGEEIIRALPAAGILANLSNTAWFGRSLAQPQHLQIARLRALEAGRPMLRATNTGMTAIVAADGSVAAALPAFTTGVLRGEVRAHAGTTPYVRWGNGAFLALVFAALVAALRPQRRVR
ncbi:MAG: apolipoprotein N-acyltransferase [Betaproteobacteria bacterium]|nr:apolipoprotein N-acyltransferase [Betaproteobacteria bacterium]